LPDRPNDLENSFGGIARCGHKETIVGRFRRIGIRGVRFYAAALLLFVSGSDLAAAEPDPSSLEFDAVPEKRRCPRDDLNGTDSMQSLDNRDDVRLPWLGPCLCFGIWDF